MKLACVATIFIGGVLGCSSGNTTIDIKDPTSSRTTKLTEDRASLKASQPVKLQVVDEILIENVFELQQTNSIVLIDTRSPVFYRLGHIDGAINIPLKSFSKNLDKSKVILDTAMVEGKKIVIYCQSEKCPDSFIMARSLNSSGYPALVFKGGWELWKMSGL